MFKKAIFTLLLLLLCVCTASANQWESSTAIVTGLSDVGFYSTPYVYNNGTYDILISGDTDGTFSGWYRDGSSWTSDSTIVSGLTSVVSLSAPSGYNNGTYDILISGDAYGTFSGWYRDGSSWTSDSTIVSGLGDIGFVSYPTVYNNGTYDILIAGNSIGEFYGWYRDGSIWVSDSTIVSGLTYSEYHLNPTVYNNGTYDILISGQDGGTFSGWYRDGSSWTSDSTIVSGLTDIGDRSSPTIYNNGTHNILITGEVHGEFDGWYLNTPSSKPIITTPSNLDTLLSQPITITATSTDPDGDPLTYYHYADGTLLGSSDTETFKWYAYYSGHYDLTVRTNDGYSFSDYSDAVTVDVVLAPSEVYDDNIMENLSGWWKLDDDYVDSSGNNDNGTNYGSTFVDGYIYNASSFDGIDDYILTTPNNNTPRTIATWIKRSGGVSESNIVFKGIFPTGTDYVLRIIEQPSSKLSVGVVTDAGESFGYGIYDIIDDTWYHTAVTYDDKYLRFYVNGNEEWSYYTNSAIVNTNTSLNIGGFSSGWDFNGDIDDVKIYNRALSAEQIKYIYNLRTIEPAPDSTQQFTYPPLLHDITLTGPDTAPSYKYQVSRDASFNLIAAEGFVFTNEAIPSLGADSYWWRVFGYNETLDQLSNSSTVWQFDIDSTGGEGDGTGISGVVYSESGGTSTELTDAVVSIWNNTWSAQQITGSNGYYLFDTLGNGTYSLQATKIDYSDSQTQYVTVVYNETIIQNILMEEREDESQYYSPHYVKFTVKNIWDTRYKYVDAKVYKGDDVTATHTGTTESDGSITFNLNEYQEYRLTFVNTTQGINEELVLYPKDDMYNVYVKITSLAPDEQYSSDEIDISVSKQTINNSHAYINVTYLDNLAETESLKVYLNQSTTSDLFNQTVIDSYSSVTNNTTISFIVEDYAGETYFVNVDVVHTTFDNVKRSYAVAFDGMTEDHGFSQVYIWLAIGGIMFTGMLFKATNARYGAFVVCVVAWVFIIIEWFDNLGDKGVLAITAGVTLATILSIAAIMAKGEKEG